MENKKEYKKRKPEYICVFDNLYPLPTKIICDRPDLKKHVAVLNKFIQNHIQNQKHNKQADFDIGLVEIANKMYDAFYSKGLKDMDKMHCTVEKLNYYPDGK